MGHVQSQRLKDSGWHIHFVCPQCNYSFPCDEFNNFKQDLSNDICPLCATPIEKFWKRARRVKNIESNFFSPFHGQIEYEYKEIEEYNKLNIDKGKQL